jgi:hypothetical protein
VQQGHGGLPETDQLKDAEEVIEPVSGVVAGAAETFAFGGIVIGGEDGKREPAGDLALEKCGLVFEVAEIAAQDIILRPVERDETARDATKLLSRRGETVPRGHFGLNIGVFFQGGQFRGDRASSPRKSSRFQRSSHEVIIHHEVPSDGAAVFRINFEAVLPVKSDGPGVVAVHPQFERGDACGLDE